MSSFDKLQTSTPDHAAQKPAESSQPHFVQTANIVIDHSHAWEQDLDTLQRFWKWVYDRQPGLMEQFQHQGKHNAKL
jgi:hypothetical protein